MIDRPARNNLLSAIEAYLGGSIKSFEFDERIHKLLPSTRDRTVHAAVTSLWLLYDDIIDHPVKFSKEQWDYVQRLCLILHTNGEIISTSRIFSRQWFALGGVALLAFSAFCFGWDWPLFLINFGVGVGATVILRVTSSHRSRLQREEIRRTPFRLFRDIRMLRAASVSFKKRPYPRTIDTGPIRTQFRSSLPTAWAYILFSLVSPLVLLLLLFPLAGSQAVELPPASRLRVRIRA